MVAYVLENTLTENGTVSRGVCKVRYGLLESVTERTNIKKSEVYGAEFSLDGGETFIPIAKDTPVSMNVWGFTKSMIDYMEEGFKDFLKSLDSNKEKAEYYLPTAVDNAIKEGKATVKVLTSSDKWHGVTYIDDKESVTKALTEMFDMGKYPVLR